MQLIDIKNIKADSQNNNIYNGIVNTYLWMHLKGADKRYREKIDRNFTRMLRAIVNKSWKQHPMKQPLVEGGPKAPFSIATTPRCRRGRYSLPSIASLYS